MKRLATLEETRQEIISYMQRLDSRLENSEITQQDHSRMSRDVLLGMGRDEILQKIDHEIAREKRKQVTFATSALACVLVLAILGFYFVQDTSITGYVIKQGDQTLPFNIETSAHTEKLVELSNVTSLKISGSIEGESATVLLRTGTADLVVAELSGQLSYTLSIDKSYCVLGENITITSEVLQNSSVYASHNGETTLLNSTTYQPAEEGFYSIVEMVSTGSDIITLEANFTVGNETLESQPVSVSSAAGAASFEDLCNETCNITATDNPILIIEPTNAKVTISNLDVTTIVDNNAPIQVLEMPSVRIAAGEERVIDASEYFTDPDGDELHYEVTEIQDVNVDVTGNLITISSGHEGNYTAAVYATDGEAMTVSNEFTIEIGGEAPVQNTSANASQNLTNPQDQSYEGVNTPDCSKPVAERPSYCFTGVEEKAFKDIAAAIEDKKGVQVGRFTRFGNLVIKGKLVEGSSGEPAADDFKIGYQVPGEFGESTVHTIWVDSEGDLHLLGTVHEESEVLEPPQFDSYIIKNSLGIVLAYFDQKTGDLYLRGNMVQLGKV